MKGLKEVFFQHSFKIVAATSLWVVAIAYLLALLNISWINAIVHAFSLHFMLILGFWLMSNIFTFYSPRSKDFWVLLIFPLVVAIILSGVLKVFNDMFFSFYQIKEIEEDIVFYFHVLYLMLILVFWSMLLVFSKNVLDDNSFKEREEKNQKIAREAELHYLKQQFQPHFLFNSLNSINALIGGKPDQAREMLIRLSEFLRSTLRQDGSKWVSLTEEIEQLNLFLSIEKVRFGDRLSFQLEVEDAVDQLKVPQLLIQPLLENAIKHGLYGQTGKVLILMRIFVESNNLMITVENPVDVENAQPKGSGFGLESLQRRLFLMFGRSDLLRIAKDEQLFKVFLKIPQIL